MVKILGEDDYKVSAVGGGLRSIRGLDGEIHGYEGMIRTPLGYVDVYGWEMSRGKMVWSFSAIFDGREYTMRQERTASDALTERGAKIVAHRWIQAVHRRLQRRSGEEV